MQSIQLANIIAPGAVGKTDQSNVAGNVAGGGDEFKMFLEGLQSTGEIGKEQSAELIKLLKQNPNMTEAQIAELIQKGQAGEELQAVVKENPELIAELKEGLAKNQMASVNKNAVMKNFVKVDIDSVIKAKTGDTNQTKLQKEIEVAKDMKGNDFLGRFPNKLDINGKPVNHNSILNQNKLSPGIDFVENANVSDKPGIKAIKASLNSGNGTGINQYSKGAELLKDNLIEKRPVDFAGAETQSFKTGFEPGQTPVDILKVEVNQLNGLGEVNAGSDSQKTLDLSNIQAKNTSEVINRITTYLEHNGIQNADKIDVMVKHDELGDFKVSANKVGNTNLVDLKIETTTKEASNFFNQNEVELIKNLNQNGVKLSDVKIMASSDKSFMAHDSKGSSNNDFSGSSNRESSHGQQQRHSENHDSQRRRQLWQEFSERHDRAFA